MPNLRYSARKNDRDEYWSVIDIFTGQPTFYKDIQLDCLDFDEVDDNGRLPQRPERPTHGHP